jgi:retinol dehydrogenase-14
MTFLGEHSYSGATAYNQSRLANLLFTYELARRLQGTSGTANALHPGMVSTGFGGEDPGRAQRLLVTILRPFMLTADQGAKTTIHLASAPDLTDVSGRFFTRRKPRRSSNASYDQATAAQLWKVSAEMTGLTPTG